MQRADIGHFQAHARVKLQVGKKMSPIVARMQIQQVAILIEVQRGVMYGHPCASVVATWATF